MKREIQLNPYEARVLGVLVEKALTTPDGYPLTLNAAVNGANQKSNRDPVLDLDEVDVAKALRGLEEKHLVRRVFPGNSRVEKYAHTGREGTALDSTALAILADLMMRGPQTPGELRIHVSRMIPIETMERLSELLQPMINDGWVEHLPPSPGSRAERYMQLVCPGLHPIDVVPAGLEETSVAGQSRLETLSSRVEALEAEVKRLKSLVEGLLPPEPVDE